MSKKPLILLTNDDGYDSPGLLAAADALCDLGDLLIVAPSVQQSGMGRSWPDSSGTMKLETVTVAGRPHPAYAVDCSPAQAVAHGLLRVTPRRPDLAISGINYGQNLGTAVTSSGTVGAALQAALAGIPSLAVSLEMDKDLFLSNSGQVDFSVAAQFTRRFAARLLALRKLPSDVHLLKIDVPRDATPETGWKVTRQSRHQYFVAEPPPEMPLGEPVRIDYRVDPSSSEPGTDTFTLAYDRLVSVTPLSIDLTSRTSLEHVEILLTNGHDPFTA